MSSTRSATTCTGGEMEPATATAEKLCRRFSLAEIQSATGGFSEERVIGRGGFGKVYKGVIDNGSVIVAVKRLESNSSGQGKPEFVTEIETLTKLRHRNVVSLIGYCNEQDEMVLVYEYIANGTLADHLHKQTRNSHSPLTWSERLFICIGAGRGLDYLHTGSSMIHRDVKSTNILLDENLVAKVSDFGLAKHLSEEVSQSIASSSIKGSYGYIDPCVLASSKHTMESDIYAFAVVLLEALSERPALDRSLPKKEQLLADWAQEKFRRGKSSQIVAPSLKGKVSKDSIKTFVEVAIKCLDHQPEKRPTMTQVLAQLESALRLQERKSHINQLSMWPFNAFKTRVIPSGLNMHEESTPAIQEDSLEDRQNANMLPAIVPAIQLVELKGITHDFSSKCLIGCGSSGGSVFHGVLKTGQHHAAIKRLNKNLSDQEFLEQVSMVSSLKHENVVKLLGYCLDGSVQILAYEFALQGSLNDVLHGRKDTKGSALEPGPALSWFQRIKIAVGAAKGLHYIHDKELIHRNIKSSNVLLFDDEIVKITDFCVSPGEELYPFAIPSGCCHRRPECGCPGQSEKGDVYSFGVVILELLTGRKPLDPELPEGRNLVTWATSEISEGNLLEIVDKGFGRDYPLKAVAGMAKVAASCLEKEAELRPDMTTVLRDLQSASWETEVYIRKHHQCLRRRSNLSPEISTMHSELHPDSRMIGGETPEEAPTVE